MSRKKSSRAKTYHETVGWLGFQPIPGGMLDVVTECKNTSCGCHKAAREMYKR